LPPSKSRRAVRASVLRLEKPYESECVKFKIEFQIGVVLGCASGGCPAWTLRSASVASVASVASSATGVQCAREELRVLSPSTHPCWRLEASGRFRERDHE
jgi:hypothetical protein